MGIVTGKVTLAPFAHDWVGGDIDGLAQLASTLYGYRPEITDVAAALDAQVQQVAGAAGWQGKAASAFTAAWQRDSRAAQVVGRIADQVAATVGWLAMALSQIEAALEQAADEASAHGVPIGADGAPPQACYAGTGGPAQAAAQQWLSDYQVFYAACLRAAQAARQQAATALGAMTRQIVDSASSKLADTLGSVNTVGDLIYDLLSGSNGQELSKAIQKAWYGSGAHTPISKDDPEPDDGDGDGGVVGLIDELSATIGALLNTYTDVHQYHKPLLESLLVESLGAEAGLRLPQLPKLISLLASGETAEGEAGGEGGEAGEAVAGGEAAIDGIDPLALAGVVLNDDIHNAFIEPWGTDVHDHGVVVGVFDGYENVTEFKMFADLKDQATTAADLNSKVSLADLAIDHPKAIGDEIDRIERAWDDPERALPGGLP
jgi:uncharacterized protein YukE